MATSTNRQAIRDPHVIPQGPADLPPAGYARDEVLAERTDALAEAAENLAATNEVEAIDPAKYVVENEIATHFDPATQMLKVSNASPAFAYCWTFSGANGLMITQKQLEGWEVVCGDMREAIEHKGLNADTVRRIGDTVLMRIRKDLYLQLIRRNELKAARFNASSTRINDALRAKAERLGIPIHETLDDAQLKRMHNASMAKTIADRKINELIREGRIPGARVG
jgi:hypothetical protein